MEDEQYLVLDYPFPMKALQLGALIRDYSNPTADFYFPNDMTEMRDIYVFTDKNVEEIMTTSPSKIERSLLRRMLSSHMIIDLSETYQVQSAKCQFYQLITASGWFQMVGDDMEAHAWLLRNLKQRQDVYLVTGYRTFQDCVFQRKVHKTTLGPESASTPLSALIGDELPNPVVSAGHSSTESDVQPRFQAAEEMIFAISCRKIKLKMFYKTQKASLQREHDWFRPWASLHVKTGDESKMVSSRGKVEGQVHPTTLTADNRDDEFDLDLASETAERGSDKPPSPPSTFQRSMPGLFEPLPGSADAFPSQTSETSPTPEADSISARQDLLPYRSTGVEEPSFLRAPVSPAVHGMNTVHELVYEVDGSQEAVRLEQLDIRIISVTHSMAWDDESVRSRPPIYPALFMHTISIATEEWARMLADESSLKPSYKKAFDVIAKDDFEGTFAQLLHEFSEDIESSAAFHLEEIAANFVKTRASRTATLVTRYLYATDLDHAPANKSPIDNSAYFDSLFARLKQYHELHYSSHGVESVRELGGDDGDDDQDLLTSLELPHPNDVTSFLLDGSAFFRFREALETYVDLRDDVGHSIVETVQESTPSKAGIPMSGLLFYVPSRTNILVAVTSAIAAAYPWSHTDCSEEGCVVRKRWIHLRPLGIVAILLVFVFSLFIPFKSVLHAVTSKRIQTRTFHGLGQLLTRFITDLRGLSRPQVPHGHERIEWVCDCGIALYDDFEVTDDESMDAIREYLHPSSSGSGSSNDNTNPLRNTPTIPHQVHANPTGSLSRAMRASDANTRSNGPAQVDMGSPSHSPETRKPSKFLELCVNRGKWEKMLGEIDITDMVTDGELFRAIAEKYDSVRGIRAKNLYLLEPADIHFVRFSLEDRHLVNIDEKPDSWPSPEFISEQSWEYTHPPKISAANFLHHMRCKRPHPRPRWLPTLPKKLKCRMDEEESDLPMGWGIHIIEGLNKTLVSWLFWVTTLVVFMLSVFWSIWKQKGAGVGPLALGILALAGSFLTSKFYEQLDT